MRELAHSPSTAPGSLWHSQILQSRPNLFISLTRCRLLLYSFYSIKMHHVKICSSKRNLEEDNRWNEQSSVCMYSSNPHNYVQINSDTTWSLLLLLSLPVRTWATGNQWFPEEGPVDITKDHTYKILYLSKVKSCFFYCLQIWSGYILPLSVALHYCHIVLK